MGILAGSAGSCTLCKPIVGAVTGPFIVLGESGATSGNYFPFQCHGDGRALVFVFGFLSAAGAVGGLVTGIASDIYWLTGDAENPTHNWYHPYRTNRGG